MKPEQSMIPVRQEAVLKPQEPVWNQSKLMKIVLIIQERLFKAEVQCRSVDDWRDDDG